MTLARVPDGEIATIVTSLHMIERPSRRAHAPSDLRLDRWREPALARYRALFRTVGEPWLWFSRLVIADAALARIIHDPAVEVFAVTDLAGAEVGLLELDFRERGSCEIAYFGLVPTLTGRGHGGWLMGQALALAWRPGVGRVWVHTCTLDSPGALGFYVAHGFRPIGRAIETFADPRLAGILPRAAAAQIPLLDPASRT